MSTLFPEIADGIALLDERVPDWRERIDVDGLHMADCQRCVIGQLYGDYGEGLYELGIEDEGGIDYGLSLMSPSPAKWGWLTRAWKAALR